jgi:hypothetical protein
MTLMADCYRGYGKQLSPNPLWVRLLPIVVQSTTNTIRPSEALGRAESHHFLKRAQDEGEDPLAAAYELFRLLRNTSKHTLLSVVREANKLGTFRAAYITSRLQPPGTKDHPVYPQDNNLLNITYERSDLAKYDDLI